MRQIQRQRHEILRFTARITEHHALVTGALILGIGPFNSLVDVFGLLVNRAQYTTRLRLEHVIAFGIADSADYLPSDGLYIEVRTALDLARQNDLACRNKCFTRHFRSGVKGQKLINQSIADLISNFVGMSFRNGLGGKEIAHDKKR